MFAAYLRNSTGSSPYNGLVVGLLGLAVAAAALAYKKLK